MTLRVERETGIEPATSSLGSLHSTAELLPHNLLHSLSLKQKHSTAARPPCFIFWRELLPHNLLHFFVSQAKAFYRCLPAMLYLFGGNYSRIIYFILCLTSKSILPLPARRASSFGGNYSRNNINFSNRYCAPRGIRTPNPQLRRLMLYPVELWARKNVTSEF